MSEKALKFKISTESSILAAGRKSYPGSRKGSRERVQHLNHSELAKMVQKGKLRCGGFSFDQHCLVGNKKLSFDTPEFLDEYASTLKKKFEQGLRAQSDSDEESKTRDECVISKETLNLNKRNSEHSVKVPASLEEKRSILKCSLPNDNPKTNNREEEDAVTNEEPKCPNNTRENSIKNNYSGPLSVNRTSDSTNSIPLNDDVEDDKLGEQKSNRSIMSRFRQFADRFGFSSDKDPKPKHSTKNNNCIKGPTTQQGKKKESTCCGNQDDLDVRKASTLPKSRTSGGGKRTWKFPLGKEKRELAGWASDAAVDKLSTDNQSLPSTSKLQSNCASPNPRSAKSTPDFPDQVTSKTVLLIALDLEQVFS